MYWTSSSGKIELQITGKQAAQASHTGKCDDDVKALSWIPAIRAQLLKIDAETLKAELREFGAWDDEELKDHEQNLQRLLWVACGDLVDEAGGV